MLQGRKISCSRISGLFGSVAGLARRAIMNSAHSVPIGANDLERPPLRAYETPTELRAGLTQYFMFYNTRRRHSALDRRTPDAVYYEQANCKLVA